jgi:hypothetical protein
MMISAISKISSHLNHWLIFVLNILTHTKIKHENQFYKWVQLESFFEQFILVKTFQETLSIKQSTLILKSLKKSFILG